MIEKTARITQGRRKTRGIWNGSAKLPYKKGCCGRTTRLWGIKL